MSVDRRDAVMIYRSFVDAIAAFPPDSRLRLYESMVAYGLEQIEPILDGMEMVVFNLIRPQMDANYRRYLKGCRGGQPRKMTFGVSTTPESE
jgi:hypothetical protein